MYILQDAKHALPLQDQLVFNKIVHEILFFHFMFHLKSTSIYHCSPLLTFIELLSHLNQGGCLIYKLNSVTFIQLFHYEPKN